MAKKPQPGKDIKTSPLPDRLRVNPQSPGGTTGDPRNIGPITSDPNHPYLRNEWGQFGNAMGEMYGAPDNPVEFPRWPVSIFQPFRLPPAIPPNQTQNNYTANPLPGFNEGFGARVPLPSRTGYTPATGIGALDRFVTTMPLHIGIAGGYSPVPLGVNRFGHGPLGPGVEPYGLGDYPGNPVTPGGIDRGPGSSFPSPGHIPNEAWQGGYSGHPGMFDHIYYPQGPFGIPTQNQYTAPPARRHLAL